MKIRKRIAALFLALFCMVAFNGCTDAVRLLGFMYFMYTGPND